MDRNINKKDFSHSKTEPKSSGKSFTHKAGDAIERMGEKVKDMGATKTGQAIYKAGNKLEHSRDHKK